MAKINCFAEDKGWLFADLLALFGGAGCETSHYPHSDADAWIAIRSSELRRTPDISRTVIQVHNMEPHDIDIFNKALGVVFTHPMQYWLWRREGFKNNYIIRPIGSRRTVVPGDSLPQRPTLGFFCGENKDRWKGSDIFEKAVLLARKNSDFDCLMIGRNLAHIEYLGRYEPRAAGVEDYSRIDALFCASISPGVPLSVYEACAAGKTVITTGRWFPKGSFPSVRLGENPGQLAKHIATVMSTRQALFDRRHKIASMPYDIDTWVKQNVDFAQRLYEKKLLKMPLAKKAVAS